MPPTPKTVDLAPSTRPQTAGVPSGPRLTKDAPLAVRLAAVTMQVWQNESQFEANQVSIRKAAAELGLSEEQIDAAFQASTAQSV